MTIDEALKKGITAVRKPYWHETAYLELPPKIGNRFGPWCQAHNTGETIPMLLVYADDKENNWEIFEKEIQQ